MVYFCRRSQHIRVVSIGRMSIGIEELDKKQIVQFVTYGSWQNCWRLLYKKLYTCEEVYVLCVKRYYTIHHIVQYYKQFGSSSQCYSCAALTYITTLIGAQVSFVPKLMLRYKVYTVDKSNMQVTLNERTQVKT